MTDIKTFIKLLLIILLLSTLIAIAIVKGAEKDKIIINTSKEEYILLIDIGSHIYKRSILQAGRNSSYEKVEQIFEYKRDSIVEAIHNKIYKK